MANRYGEAALMAVRMGTYGKAMTPAERWQDAVSKQYPTSPAAQRKGAPRVAFVDLCEAGLVKGITPGRDSSAAKNRSYAVRAAELLRAGTHHTVSQLWAEVTGGEPIAHNSQMDVVLALWKNGLLAGAPAA